MITASRREYLRRYQSEWARKRRMAWIAERGPCVRCGSTDSLEIDHVHPETKSEKLRRHQAACIWTWRKDKRLAELAKCQILCGPCHKAKTIAEIHGRPRSPVAHGTYAGYDRGCRCDDCRSAYSTIRRARYLRTGR